MDDEDLACDDEELCPEEEQPVRSEEIDAQVVQRHP